MTEDLIVCKTRKWGNSLGIRIPKETAEDLNIRENEDVVVGITKKENPLKELFGFDKKHKITKELVKDTKKLLEARW